MCPWGHLAANLADLPAIASMSLLEVPPSYLLKTGEVVTTLTLIPRFLPWIRPYRKATRRLEVEYLVSFPDLYTVINRPGDLTINYTSASIHPDSSKLGPEYLFVGPAIPAAPPDIEFPFDQLGSERPLIYISLGTVFNDNPSFFRDCIAAFAESDYQVVMTLGKRLPIETLGEIPPNFIVRSYVPQLQILKHADLFITHGGVNSVHQGLYYGVPLLLVPQQLEQALVAARLAELGAGAVLRKPSTASLRSMAGRLLDDRSYRLQAVALSEDLMSAGGVSRAADEIEVLGAASPA
jgi:MGT family glycosyltransferase